MQIHTIQTPIQAELAAISELIVQRLDCDIPLISLVYQHITQGGGKRLRPTLALLAAGACGDISAQQMELALIIEFIHTATLLHDDVVDESSLRRGQPSANALWGNQASVLVGDFLLARAFQLLVPMQNQRLLQLLAQTTRDIAAGEVLQLVNRNDAQTTVARYLQVIQYKTATLFVAASQGAALLTESTEAQINALAEFGLNLGLAFQLIDDALDYAAESETLGKNRGDDLREGKLTLPLLYALQHVNAEQRQLIHAAIDGSQLVALSDILAVIASVDAIPYTYQVAREYTAKAQAALQHFPASIYREALADLLTFVVTRHN